MRPHSGRAGPERPHVVIKKVFETHIPVADLERAMNFYESVLGLQLGMLDSDRRIAFYWVGGENHSMLGLWEKGDVSFVRQHFAFEIAEADIPAAMELLGKHNITGYNFLQDGTNDPMVFAWMPALAIYFKDPDGNELEFIAPLEGKPDPRAGILSLEKWKQANRS